MPQNLNIYNNYANTVKQISFRYVCSCSVPAFKSEWYWKDLESGNKDFVEFHNRVYGCSGVMPDKYPCTGFEFK